MNLRGIFGTPRRDGGHDAGAASEPTILVIGHPNVGKSLLFNRLTGEYATVSNYPGTTVEIFQGCLRSGGRTYRVVDTPGIYSLAPITAEEGVTLDFLLRSRAHAVIHVVDAKNLDRMLGLTLQLAETGQPLVLALNMADEARALGISIDVAELSRRLGIVVVRTVATTGEGIAELIRAAVRAAPAECPAIDYGPPVEPAIRRLAELVGGEAGLSARSRAVLLLQEESAPSAADRWKLGDRREEIEAVRRALRAGLDHSPQYHMSLRLRQASGRLLEGCLAVDAGGAVAVRERWSLFLLRPLTGIPILLAVLYVGLYQFVGRFGGGTLVDWLEGGLFGGVLNPWFERHVSAWVPWPWLAGLLVGEYGVLTLGLRYALGIVMPIVGTFFLAFAALEDSGYLPRMALLVDRWFKRLGLNGRAVIPMVLGFGCGTMATLVTRTLETRRERIIATFLLALTVPCSAQVGVVLGLLAGHAGALLLWSAVILAVFAAAGTVLARVVPGAPASFYMELPPIRAPRLSNVLAKTGSRLAWYFREVLPLFVLASVLLWAGSLFGVFSAILGAVRPFVQALGLPGEAAVAFVFGFFRRDYGAAGLYDLQRTHALTANQLAVAAIALTLFLPCVAQLLIMQKERGWRFSLGTALGAGLLAFGVGWVTHAVLTVFHVRLP